MSESWGGRYVDHQGYGEEAEREAGPTGLDRQASIRLAWVSVAVLGVVAWALGFAAPTGALPAVRLDLMAAAVAAVGLLPGQHPRGWLAAALAATGLGATLSALPTQAQWAVIATVVLDAVQTLVAFGAVGLPVVARRPRVGTTPQDEEYARYLREYQAYVDYYGHPPPDQDPTLTAAGQATGVAVNQAQVAADRDAAAAIRAKYDSPHPASAPAPGPRGDDAARAPGVDPGMPGTGYAGRASDQGARGAAPQEVRRPPGY